MKTNAFFCLIQGEDSSRDFFTLGRILRLYSVLKEGGRERRIYLALSTAGEINYSSSYSYLSLHVANFSAWSCSTTSGGEQLQVTSAIQHYIHMKELTAYTDFTS